MNIPWITDKVAEAEKKKAEAHAEHQRKALICNKAELEVRLTMVLYIWWCIL